MVGPLCVLAWTSVGLFEHDAGAALLGFCGSIGSIAVGRAVRLMSFETDVLEAKVGTLQEEQQRRARDAVVAERERISRELHDVIGHSISVMGIQAGAVRRVLPPELERERAMLEALERTGRDSVGEMQRLIGLLRTHDDVADEAQPTLARVDVLVDEVRRARRRTRLLRRPGRPTARPRAGRLPHRSRGTHERAQACPGRARRGSDPSLCIRHRDRDSR
jgi:signal transduction histidine kinase